MNNILVFGAGQVAQVFADYLGHEFAKYVVDREYATPGMVCAEDVQNQYAKDYYRFVVGMSFRGLNKPRAEKFQTMLDKGYAARTYISPQARLSGYSDVGVGSFVMDGNTLQRGVEVGRNVVIWSNNHLGHDTKIGDHVWLSSGITVSGACEIGEYTFIGSGATIADGVKVGKRCIIGAGSLVLRDVPDDSVVAAEGTPISKVSSARAARLLG